MDEVYRRVAELRPLLPEGIEIVPDEEMVDFSISIRESVRETEFALLFGGLLAVLVVFVFLRRTRPTLIVAAAIPLSLTATFGLVWVFGYTLNTMTLLGMTIAIGVVIDDAIIVLENVERHRDMGKSGVAAASDGTRQILFAATAATISVAAVFVPVAFAEGIVGNFLGAFGLTVAGSVLVSLFVALTLTPMLAARMPAAALSPARQCVPPPRGRLRMRSRRAIAGRWTGRSATASRPADLAFGSFAGRDLLRHAPPRGAFSPGRRARRPHAGRDPARNQPRGNRCNSR